jgi:hypothetical protein
MGRFPSRRDAGFVGLEAGTTVRGKARFPRTLITTLDPVTVEVELDSAVRRSSNAAIEKDSIEFENQNKAQTQTQVSSAWPMHAAALCRI